MTYTTERLSADSLLNILALSDNATAIYTTEDIIIETANDKMIAAWQKDRGVIGKRIEDALPEMKGQSFFKILKEVWRTGNTYNARNVPAYIDTNGQMQRYYFNFEFRAVKNPDGSMLCILHTAHDVTDAVQKGDVIQSNEVELLKLTHDLSRVNRSYAEKNDDLNQLNDNLISVQKDMSIMYARLSASEEKFRFVIEQIPIAFNVLRTRELKVEIVNDLFLEIWGKNLSAKEVSGKRLTDINPEFIGQPFMKALDDVYTTGKTYHSPQEKAFIERNGVVEVRYYDLIYHALKNEVGDINGIFQIARDVTPEVMILRQVKDLNDELAATNEELAAGNEELRSLNEEMLQIQDDLHETNRKLVENEERFRAITSSHEVGVSITNTVGMPIYINEMLSTLSGLSLQEFAKIGYANLVHPDDKEEYFKSFDLAFVERKEYTDRFRFRSHNGEYRILSSYVMPMSDRENNFIGFVRTLRDVTERDEIEAKSREMNEELAAMNEELAAMNEELAAGNEELRSLNEEMLTIQSNLLLANNQLSESEERFRSMAESTTVFICVSNENGEPTYFNKVWSEVTGRRNSHLLAFGWDDLIHPDDKESAVSLYRMTVQKGETFINEFRILAADGKFIWLLVNGIARQHPNGAFAGHIVSALDITERKRDDQRKNDFIGMVSHELKTPLTSLNGYLDIVRLDLKESGQKTEADLLEKAARQVSKMTSMINGFLNVSRLESGKLQIDKQRFDLGKLIEEVKGELSGAYNNHTLHFHPCEEIFVNADWDKMGHVINNFISNAAKYSPYHTEINIICKQVADKAVLSVSDRGIGIAPEYQGKLFERYYRVENDNVRSIAGFGIGLYLCAEIIQRNGGEIWLESELGKGSTFFFSLPVVL